MKTAKNKKILLIEDHPDLVSMYEFAFKKIPDAELFTAVDSIQGMEQAKKIAPDVILLDIIIPESSTSSFRPELRMGWNLLADLRKDPKLKKTKVIALTNLDSQGDRDTAKKLGCLEYIVKANTLPKDVVLAVKRYL